MGRFVVIGLAQKASAVLEPANNWRTLSALLEGSQPSSVAPALLEAGVVTHEGGRYRLGPRAVRIAERNGSLLPAITTVATRAAGALVRHIGSLRNAAADIDSAGWNELGFLIVGALVLDLELGEVLRERDVIPDRPAGWTLLVLPVGWRTASFGVCACWDPATGTGAGEAWYETMKRPYVPPPWTLADLFAAKEIGTPVDRLTLRYRGWAATTSRVLRIPQDALLWDVVNDTAGDLLRSGYGTFLASVDPEERLLVHRLLLDCVLEQVTRTGSVETGPSRRLWMWRGRNYRILGSRAA